MLLLWGGWGGGRVRAGSRLGFWCYAADDRKSQEARLHSGMMDWHGICLPITSLKINQSESRWRAAREGEREGEGAREKERGRRERERERPPRGWTYLKCDEQINQTVII